MSRPIPIEEMVRLFKSRHTTSHLFKIDNFSLFAKYQIERVESSVFILGGLKWKLYVYPNGKKNANGHVSIFLENQSSVMKQLQYQVFAVSQLEKIWHPSNVIFEFGPSVTSKSKGITKLISHGDLEKNGYLIGDCCMFGVKLHGFEPGTQGTAECFSLVEKPLNHKVTWMMTQFSSFDPSQSHHSNEFVVGNRKWRIKIHSRGWFLKGGLGRSFSVHLSGEGFINNAPKMKTFAKFKLRVLDQLNRNHIEKTDSDWFDAETGYSHGFEDFMPLQNLDEPYLVKDKLYVGVDFEVISITNYC